MRDLSSADRRFLRAMIAHHEDALSMSKAYLSEPASERQAGLSDMARAIVKNQSEEIARMKRMFP